MASVEPTAKVGWEYKTLGEMCDIVNGATPKTKVAEYWEGSHQWITPAEMGNRETPYISNTNRTLTDSGLANCSASLLPAKSVILSSRAPIGHLVINDVPMAFNQGCKGLVPPKDLEYKFLYYFLFSSVELLNSLGTGATFKELSATKLKQVPFPLPPLSEQERIVGILDEAFEGIAAATAQAEKNLHNARELFQSVLQSTFSQKGDDWVETTLGEVCENLDSKRIPITKNKRVAGEIPYYGASGIVDHVAEHIFDEDLLLVSEDGANLLARTYPIAFSISGKTWVNNHAHVLKFEDLAAQHFMEFYLNSIKLDPYVSGMAQPKLNQKSLNSIPVPSPPLPTQQAIVDKLDALSEETKRLEAIYERKQSALAELKQSLLQKAFAGEL